jgi:hypothetical protein
MTGAELVARTLARKAAGENQEYPGHAGKIAAAPPAPAPLAPKPPPVLADCPHRSAEPVDSVQCPTCRGNVQVYVFACAVAAHPTCTLSKTVRGHHTCRTCKERPPA